MGGLPTSLRCGRKPIPINIIGESGAGKTTILYRYKLGLKEPITTMHTIGFNVETITYKNISFEVIDPGGGDKIQPIWRQHFKNKKVLIFVVDSSDDMYIDVAKHTLEDWLYANDERDVVLLVFANKQDLPNAMTTSEIIYKMQLKKLKYQWHIQPVCGLTGKGIIEGFEWLYQKLL